MMNLSYFTQINLYQALQRLFAELNIPVNYLTELPADAPDILTTTYNPNNPAHRLMQEVYLLGGVDDSAFQPSASALTAASLKQQRYEGLLIFGVTLHRDGSRPTRSQMAEITRAFNREFHYTPVVVVFQYLSASPSERGQGGEVFLSFASCERLPYQQSWREGDKAGKVSLLKDVNPAQPHAGHLRILDGLRIERAGKQAIATFEALYQHWQEVFSVSLLNKRFFQDMANWYFWATQAVRFPEHAEKDCDGRDSLSVIRLLTRLIFVWFMKERGLIPEKLFIAHDIETYLKHLDNDESSYYLAILQNLFFATLNTPVNERKFRTEQAYRKGYNPDFGNHDVYRHHKLFHQNVEWQALFADIPFLNGGIFECLDKKARRQYVDGFSDTPKHQPTVPNVLFFAPKQPDHVYGMDLNAVYSTSKKPYELQGLLNILHAYKFTVTENTPLEAEIALDPDLLGKVFESLLAYYNPETGGSARKQQGSFYTPQEIVDYMVDESLLAYLETALHSRHDAPNLHEALRQLLSYADMTNPFDAKMSAVLVALISDAKIFDPACGSGAFPMGILNKMVHLLRKLDPANDLWRQTIIEKTDAAYRKRLEQLERDIRTAKRIRTEDIRARTIAELEQRKQEILREFRINQPDFTRKLYLLRHCIYGVDIQSIAVLISKLRFFIALLVDTQTFAEQPNWGIEPMPNLETNFVCANALIGIERTELDLFNGELIERERALKQVRDRYFSATIRQEKATLRDEDHRIRAEMTELFATKQYIDRQTAEKLANWDMYDQNAHADFFDADWMFSMKDGFDIVIGNPPYGAKFSADEKKLFGRLFQHQDYQLDSYLLFLEKSFQFVRHHGIISFIIPNPWLTNLKLKKIRRFIVNEQTVLNITHYHRSVFDATVDTEVVFFCKQPAQQHEVQIIAHEKGGKIEKHAVAQDKWQRLNGEPINIFIDEHAERIVVKLQQDSLMLGNVCKVVSGLTPYRIGMGNPKQTKEMTDAKIYDATHKVDATYRALLRGKDIEKYLIKWDGKRWIKYGDNLAEPRYTANFDAAEKIVIRQTGDSLIATLDTKQFVCLKNMHVITAKNPEFALKYILALLNSRLLDFFYQTLNPEKGEALAEVKKENVEKLLIKQIPFAEQQPFEVLVDRILAAKQRDPAADTRALESEIDRRVYALYGLTPEEIAIVEGA